MTATQAEHQETQRTDLWRVRHLFLFIAGFIMLIGGIANFGTAASIALQVVGVMLSTSERRALITMVGVLFAMSLLCFVGSGCGWDAALHHLRGERDSRSTFVKKAFLVLVGILTIIEGVIYQNTFAFGPLMIVIGALAIVFSVPDLLHSD